MGKKREHTRRIIRIVMSLSILLEMATGYANDQWETLLETSRRSTELETVHSINQSINRFGHLPDRLVWSKTEFWATPYELISKGAGDCEDFAVAKYLALLELGVPSEHLELLWSRVYNQKKQRIEPHVVALYRPGDSSSYLVLDNINRKEISLEKRQDLLPQIRFNKRVAWIKNNNDEWIQLASHPRLKIWKDLLQRWGRQRAEPGEMLALKTNL